MAQAITIDIRELTVNAGGRGIVPPCTLTVQRGTTTVVSGPSGSGKTTLLKAVLGFIRPSGGEVLIEGVRLDAGSVWRLRRQMAYVPQELDLGDGTALDALMRPFKYRAAQHLHWDEARARGLASEFLLVPDIMGQAVKDLSGGEKQRLALVTALMLDRPVLIMDEATTGLDKASKAAVLTHIKRMPDLSVLAASHDEAILKYADDVAHLKPVSASAGDKGQ